jgi:hypothetical protein
MLPRHVVDWMLATAVAMKRHSSPKLVVSF